MENKKSKKKIFLVIVTIAILLVAIYFIFIYRGRTEDNKKRLTLAEQITLNDNEKEILSELVNVNDKLLNPTVAENTDTNSTDYTEIVKPKESISLKDFCIKLYEARKTTNEQGKTIYLFDMDTRGNNGETIRRYIITEDGQIISCSFVENDYNEALNEMEDTKYENGTLNLGKQFIKAIFEGITKAINEMWENATIYENVNYDNILKKI